MRRLRQRALEEILAEHPGLLYDTWIQVNHPRHNFDLPENRKYVEAKWVSIQILLGWWTVSYLRPGKNACYVRI